MATSSSARIPACCALNDAMIAIERANQPKFDGILTNRIIDFNKNDELPREKLINLIFGCNHPERDHSALPFTQDGMSYRVCLKCGTRIAFSVEDFKYITAGYRRRKRREAARA